MNLALTAIIGFCATAGAIGFTHVLGRFLRYPESYYRKRRNDG